VDIRKKSKEVGDNLVNAIQVVMDSLVILLGIFAVIAKVLGWSEVYDFTLKAMVLIGTLRVLVYIIEKEKSRVETMLMALPLFGFIFFEIFGAEDSLVFVFGYTLGFAVLVVHDFRDWKPQGHKKVSPPQSVRPPQPVVNGNGGLRKPGPVGGSGAPIIAPQFGALRPAGYGLGETEQKPAATNASKPHNKGLPQRDYQWFYDILKKMKTTIFQRGDQYAKERDELRLHFKNTTLDRDVLVRHNVREDLVNGVDNGDFQSLLQLLRSPSQLTEALHKDLAKALAEGCRRAQTKAMRQRQQKTRK